MGMTMTQKILAAHAGLPEVKAGQLIRAKLDMVLGNDITSPVAIREFEKEGFTGVFDKSKISMDHFTPNKDIKAAEQCLQCRTFARQFDLDNFYDVGQMGVEHALLPEKGLVAAGECIIGADSHTCTYGALGAFSTGVGSTDMAAGMATGETWFKVPEAIRVHLTGKLQPWVSGKDVILHLIGTIGVDGALHQSLEFTGEGVASLTMDDRFTISNMAIEAGAKCALFTPDEKTEAYCGIKLDEYQKSLTGDDDAVYMRTIVYKAQEFEPVMACPSQVDKIRPVRELKGTPIDQVFIGSCTNGRLEDLRLAAKLLEGKRVAQGTRLLVNPASEDVYRQALREGVIEKLSAAGAIVSPSGCGPCLGGHLGLLAPGENCLSTGNRNFMGRMGSPKANIYLGSPAVAAAAATPRSSKNTQ